jgi:hypothetical protein
MDAMIGEVRPIDKDVRSAALDIPPLWNVGAWQYRGEGNANIVFHAEISDSNVRNVIAFIPNILNSDLLYSIEN